MVEAIGWKAAGVVTKVTAAVTSAPVAAAVTQDATPNTAVPARNTAITAATGMARDMAVAAPVDTDRVSKIKAAIAAGKFPILPSTIADRLLALRLDWNPNEVQA